MNIFNKPFVENTVEEYYDNSIKAYHAKRKFFKNNNLKYLIRFERADLSLEDYIQNFALTIENLTSRGLKPSDIVVAFDNNYKKKTFSKKELYNLKKLEEIAKPLGVTVGIFDYQDVFTIKQVVNADKKIKRIANNIKAKKYSTFEKLLNAYFLASIPKYKFEDKETENTSQSRSVYGVLNSDKIVCAGYSEYLKAIVREIDDENLKVFSNHIGTSEIEHAKKDIGIHQNNIVYVKDDKYKIDGFYYLDATWDYPQANSLKYFMTEIGQIKNITTDMIDMEDATKMWLKQRQYNESNIFEEKKKIKGNNHHNTKFLPYSTVSSQKAGIDAEYASIRTNDEFDDYILSDFLMSRQDFRDFLILKETMKGQKNSNLSFDDLLEKNAEIAEKNITELNMFHNKREIFKYLKQHSPHIDIGQMQNALQVVVTKSNPQKTKDEVSKMVYDVLKQNIKNAKNCYCDKKTLWTECEVNDEDRVFE